VSYTFESGWSLTAESLYDGDGYSAGERRAAATAAAAGDALFTSDSPRAGLGAELLGQALAPGLMSVGRRYLFLQLLRSDWGNRADVALRWTRNLDDRSQAYAASLSYGIDQHVQLLAIAELNTGSPNAEFGRLVRGALLLGLKANF
jgi:hypothetical protein